MIQAFECRIRGWDSGTVLNRESAGQAKADYFRNIAREVGAKYTDIRIRRLGGPVTTDGIVRTAKYRGVPFARAGMRVKVENDYGRIVSHNDSANWDVLFETGRWAGETLNCHPNWMMTYYDDDGTVLAEFK